MYNNIQHRRIYSKFRRRLLVHRKPRRYTNIWKRLLLWLWLINNIPHPTPFWNRVLLFIVGSGVLDRPLLFRTDTVRFLIFWPLRAVAKNRRCSRLHSPETLSRVSGCFDEPDDSAYTVLSHQTKNQPIRVGLFGGRGRIRTIEAKRNRFTVCPLWPLGNSPIFNFAGAGGRTRTPDLLITNQLLYQLSYTSIFKRLNNIP